jgi:hypothetical protein
MNLAAFLQLVALSALWGASFLFIRIASPLLGPTVLAGTRVGMATLALTALMLLFKQRWPWAQWRSLLWIAVLAVAMPFVLFAWAGLHLPSSYSALINTLYVVFGCLFGAWLKVDTLNLRKMLGCAIGILGIGLIVRLGPIDLTPTMLLACAACTLAAACYGLATPLTKRALTHLEPAFGAARRSSSQLRTASRWNRGLVRRCHIWPSLLVVPAHHAPYLQRSRINTSLHDSDVRRALGTFVFGRASQLEHVGRCGHGLSSGGADQRVEVSLGWPAR